MENKEKKTLYVDMDGVIVNFESGISKLSTEIKEKYKGHLEDVPHIFSLMEPIPGAIEAVKKLTEVYDVYVLSTAPWDNSSGWADKVDWIKQHFGDTLKKRLILSHCKDLNRGHFLIDDRDKHGASAFEGEWIQFGSDRFPDWNTVLVYLLAEKNI